MSDFKAGELTTLPRTSQLDLRATSKGRERRGRERGRRGEGRGKEKGNGREGKGKGKGGESLPLALTLQFEHWCCCVYYRHYLTRLKKLQHHSRPLLPTTRFSLAL